MIRRSVFAFVGLQSLPAVQCDRPQRIVGWLPEDPQLNDDEAVLLLLQTETKRSEAGSTGSREEDPFWKRMTDGLPGLPHLPISAFGGDHDVRPICKVSRDPTERPVVMVHSMPKTGTTSIGWALELLGYADCGSKEIMNFASHKDLEVANEMVKGYKVGQVPYIVKRKALERMTQFQVDVYHNLKKTKWRLPDGEWDRLSENTTHNPICNSYSDFPLGLAPALELNLKLILWPEGQFIWIDRDFNSWVDSFIAWKELHHEKKPECSKREMRRFIANKRQELVKLQKHHPEQVLFLDLNTMGWKDLLPFLPVEQGCAPPLKHFPIANVNNQYAEFPHEALLEIDAEEFSEAYKEFDRQGYCSPATSKTSRSGSNFEAVKRT